MHATQINSEVINIYLVVDHVVYHRGVLNCDRSRDYGAKSTAQLGSYSYMINVSGASGLARESFIGELAYLALLHGEGALPDRNSSSCRSRENWIRNGMFDVGRGVVRCRAVRCGVVHCGAL
ncbi:hypothetical protein O3P69_002955 [Scylla paramamosain]|uniref:Uncharacterized protein n=1 Tax=Scylla paramamosain TaxID=85552 RepID=A0AAW0UL60_SCYPA